MKVKTLERAIMDLKKIGTGSSAAVYMTWTRLRLAKGDPDYYPHPQEFIDALGYKSATGIGSMFKHLKKVGLIPEDYSCHSSSFFLDHLGNQIKVGSSGIYCIKTSFGAYIGLSKDLNARLRSHDQQIKKGTHRYIGREEQPEFIILEHLSDNSLLIERERFWALRAIEKGINVFNEQNFT